MGLFDRLRRGSQRDDDDEQDEDDDELRAEELVPEGGTWSGLLFANPSIGLAPALTWSFELAFAEVTRDYGDTDVSLSVEWVPLPGASWTSMAGREAAGETFGEPIECSAYFFEHSRYDAVSVRVLEQDGGRIRVAVEAHGDVDSLGIPSWDVTAWLDFEGIVVQLDGTDTVEQAAERLAEHTDISGLTGGRSAQGFSFAP